MSLILKLMASIIQSLITHLTLTRSYCFKMSSDFKFVRCLVTYKWLTLRCLIKVLNSRLSSTLLNFSGSILGIISTFSYGVNFISAIAFSLPMSKSITSFLCLAQVTWPSSDSISMIPLKAPTTCSVETCPLASCFVVFSAWNNPPFFIPRDYPLMRLKELNGDYWGKISLSFSNSSLKNCLQCLRLVFSFSSQPRGI